VKEILKKHSPSKKESKKSMDSLGRHISESSLLMHEITDPQDRLFLLAILAFHPTKPVECLKEDHPEEPCSLTVGLSYSKPTLFVN
jgi:hypothetical protein